MWRAAAATAPRLTDERADLALAFITGTTITLDVGTSNTQFASAESLAAAHLHNFERAKIVKYADYCRVFMPFVIDLGGAEISHIARSSPSRTRQRRRPARGITGRPSIGRTDCSGSRCIRSFSFARARHSRCREVPELAFYTETLTDPANCRIR